MVADEDLEEGQKRLLATDNAVVLPVDTNIRILVTASTCCTTSPCPRWA